MTQLSLDDTTRLAKKCAKELIERGVRGTGGLYLVGIPRGGIPAALLIHRALGGKVVSSEDAVSAIKPQVKPPTVILVDDIMVTGETIAVAKQKWHPDFLAVLVQKGPWPVCGTTVVGQTVSVGNWVTFPWEVNDPDLGKPEDAVRRLIEYAGADPNAEHLKDTPARVLRFYDELREGAAADLSPTTFESSVDDLVVVGGISFFSLCPHHLLPVLGVAHVGYIPEGKIIGLSKLARIVAKEASGLHVQEELSRRVAESVRECTGAEHVAVVTTATHTCMVMRGVKAVGSQTTASAMLGHFRTEPALRQEFFSLTQKEA